MVGASLGAPRTRLERREVGRLAARSLGVRPPLELRSVIDVEPIEERPLVEADQPLMGIGRRGGVEILYVRRDRRRIELHGVRPDEQRVYIEGPLDRVQRL